MTDYPTYATRDEAIQAEIVTVIEASGEVPDARAAFDVEAIGEAVIGVVVASGRYVMHAAEHTFWAVVEANVRPVEL